MGYRNGYRLRQLYTRVALQALNTIDGVMTKLLQTGADALRQCLGSTKHAATGRNFQQ